MLRTRLSLGLLPLLLVLVAMGGYAIVECRQLANSLQQDLIVDYGNILATEKLRALAATMPNAAAQAQRGDPFGARRTLETNRSEFMRQLMEQSARSAGTAREHLVEEVDQAFQEFSEQCAALVAAGGDGSLETIRANDVALYRVQRAIEALTLNGNAAAQETADRANRLATTTARVLIGAMVAAILLSILLAWRLAASLLKPITALTVSVEAVGQGDLDREVPARSRDELGRLARSFNTMAARLRAYREATVARVLRTQRTMEATLTSTPDPLFVVSREGVQEVRNPAAEELARQPEFAGKFPDGIAGPLALVLETGEHYLPTDYRRVVTLRAGREDRHYLPRILAIGDKLTEFKGAAVILQDVTKFRLLDDAKTNLVGTVSHELKTPLTSLRMAVYLLLEQSLGPLTAAQLEMLESARDDADRLLKMLDSLLDLARLEAGASALERQAVPVSSLLARVADEARAFIGAAGQKLVVEEERDLGEVLVDADRLRHVFINLLTNASKYSPPGSTIALSAAREPLGFVRFAVRDEGGGIPPEALPRLFDRFYRVPGQSKPGAGIGLAIAREIVVAHGGTISCASEPGRGAEFQFLVPAGS